VNKPDPKPQLTEQSLDKKGEVDPFDLARLRLDQSFTEFGVKKLLTTVPVRKPNPQYFTRVHVSEEYRGALAIIELRDDREVYLLPAFHRPRIAWRVRHGDYPHGY
jgi:hypothetical protein